MKPIFSSLGSNYTYTDVVVSLKGLLLSHVAPKLLSTEFTQLQVFFDSTFKGQTYFFYKGRDAIECALRAYSIERGAGVLTQAFSCYAIEEAISRTGATPVYVDVAEKSVNFGIEEIKTAYRCSTVPIKAVILQYSLGSVPDVSTIIAWCRKQHILVIEDVAQGYGGKTAEGLQVGQLGDVTCFSFGRDKIVDAVAGGACCFRSLTSSQQKKISAWYRDLHMVIPLRTRCIEHLYPLVTWCVRTTFSWGVGFFSIGKVLLFLAKKLGLICSPLFVSTTRASVLPLSLVPLLAHRLAHVEAQLAHRKRIVGVYQEVFGNSAAVLSDHEVVLGSALRYPIIVKDPDHLAKKLKTKHIYITDRWYRAPVDCSTLKCTTVYTAQSCPNAEERAAHVITLPTHQGIRFEDAQRITKEIKALHT